MAADTPHPATAAPVGIYLGNADPDDHNDWTLDKNGPYHPDYAGMIYDVKDHPYTLHGAAQEGRKHTLGNYANIFKNGGDKHEERTTYDNTAQGGEQRIMDQPSKPPPAPHGDQMTESAPYTDNGHTTDINTTGKVETPTAPVDTRTRFVIDDEFITGHIDTTSHPGMTTTH